MRTWMKLSQREAGQRRLLEMATDMSLNHMFN
jgi:hypothetical protein